MIICTMQEHTNIAIVGAMESVSESYREVVGYV